MSVYLYVYVYIYICVCVLTPEPPRMLRKQLFYQLLVSA